MANISSANGVIILEGNWTEEALEAFEPVLDMWGFYGEYGIQYCDGFDIEHLQADFYGCGRWSFTGTLDSFDDWTRDWLKEKPTDRKGDLIHKLTEEQYADFLKIMHDNDLSIKIDFEDKEEGFGFHEHEVGVFTSNGERLCYEALMNENVVPSWDDYDRSALKSAVEYFEKFLEDADTKKLRKWVKNNVPPTDIFEETDFDEDIIQSFADWGEDPFLEFYHKFLPDTEEWGEFCGAYEEIYGCTPEENEDYEYYDDGYEDYDDGYDEDDEDDEDEDEDEDVNDWDDEPQYPMDDVDSLEISGNTFVLTGEFQNCEGDRDKVKEMIEAKGGRCTGAVSGKTNYLVLGDFGDIGAKKVEKALEQREKGKDIKIIAEYDLFRFL